MQSKTFPTPRGTRTVRLTLDGKVAEDFVMVVTGFDSTGAILRRVYHYEGREPDPDAEPLDLLSRIEGVDTEMSVGERKSATLELRPLEARDRRVRLASVDSGIVQVAGDSLLAVGPGRTTVIASSQDGRVEGRFHVTVKAVPLIGFVVDSLVLEPGERRRPSVRPSPVNATDWTYRLLSSDTSVARIAGDTLLALRPGRTEITVLSMEGAVRTGFRLTVVLPARSISAADLSREAGSIFLPDLTWNPPEASDRRYRLRSGDSSKVAVRGDSLVALAVGEALIEASSLEGGLRASFKVTVTAPIVRVTGLDAKPVRALLGDTVPPSILWSPPEATDKRYSLRSLDTAFAIPVPGGLAGKSLGMARVEVTSRDGGHTDTFELRVERPAFAADILPITSFKCAPCHVPGQTWNFQDSAWLVRKGVPALKRLSAPEDAGRMPVVGAPNGPLSGRELSLLTDWLGRFVIPLKGVAIPDVVMGLGDTAAPAILWDPAGASNKNYTLSLLGATDTSIVQLTRGKDSLIGRSQGEVSVLGEIEEDKRRIQFKVKVGPPSFQRNVLPITWLKCAPCHVPGQTWNFQDSTVFLDAGASIKERLTRERDAAGRMPLAGAPNGDLSGPQLAVLLEWLAAKIVPLQGISALDDTLKVGEQRAPRILWDPPGASNKGYLLTSRDTSKVGVAGQEMIGKAPGKALVEVKALDGNLVDTLLAEVVAVPLDSMTVADTGAGVGDTVAPMPRYYPANATVKGFTLAKHTNSRVTALAGNRIVGMTEGKDTLEAVATDEGKKARFVFAVGPAVLRSLAVPDTSGAVGETVTPRILWNSPNVVDRRYILVVAAKDTGIAAPRGGALAAKAQGSVQVYAVSVANPAITAAFRFTVGYVSVESFSLAPVTNYPGVEIKARDYLTWMPANASDKRFRLVSPDTSRVFVRLDTAIVLKQLGAVTVQAMSLEAGKTTNWQVEVIRTPFSGLQPIFTQKCNNCHHRFDSSSVVGKAGAIETRINNRSMPPSNSTAGPLTPVEISNITAWLRQK